MVDGVHGDTDDGAGGDIFVVDFETAWEDDAREVAGYWSTAAESFLDAGVEIIAVVQFRAGAYVFRAGEGCTWVD